MPTVSYAIIGAGPSGLAAVRNLQRYGLPWQGTNDRLKDVFGYVPSKTSAEAFDAWRAAHA